MTMLFPTTWLEFYICQWEWAMEENIKNRFDSFTQILHVSSQCYKNTLHITVDEVRITSPTTYIRSMQPTNPFICWTLLSYGEKNIYTNILKSVLKQVYTPRGSWHCPFSCFIPCHQHTLKTYKHALNKIRPCDLKLI